MREPFCQQKSLTEHASGLELASRVGKLLEVVHERDNRADDGNLEAGEWQPTKNQNVFLFTSLYFLSNFMTLRQEAGTNTVREKEFLSVRERMLIERTAITLGHNSRQRVDSGAFSAVERVKTSQLRNHSH